MRVTSEKTRQAILAVDGAIDPDFPPDRLVLFDSNGNPISFEGAHGVPPGGETGKVLGKISDDDYDVDWVDGPAPGGGGGEVEILTSKRFYEPLDAAVGSLTNVDSGSKYVDTAVFGPLPGMTWKTSGDNVSFSTEQAFRDFDAQIKFITAAAAPTGQASWAMLRRISTTKALAFFTDFFNGIFVFSGSGGGTWTSLASTPMTGYVVQPNTAYWLRARMDLLGLIVMGLYTENPRLNPDAVPVKSLTYQLANTDLTNYGPGNVGYPGLRLVGNVNPQHANLRILDYEVNDLIPTTVPASLLQDEETVETAAGALEVVTSKQFYESLDSVVGSLNKTDAGSGFEANAIFGSLPGMSWNKGADNTSHSIAQAFRDFDAQTKITTGPGIAAGGASWSMIRYVSSSAALLFYFGLTDNISVLKGNPGSAYTELAKTVLPAGIIQPNTDYWHRVRMDPAGLITAGIYTENPRENSNAVPIVSYSYQLAGADLTAYGPSKVGYPGLRLINDNAANNVAVRLRDYLVDDYVQITKPVDLLQAKDLPRLPGILTPPPIVVYDTSDPTVLASKFSHPSGDIQTIDLLPHLALNQRTTVKFAWTTGGNMGILLRSGEGYDSFLMGSLLEDNILHIHERSPSGFVEKGATAAAAVNGTVYWLEFTAIGRDVILRLFDQEPGRNLVPLKALVTTLAADSKMLYRGHPGIRHDELLAQKFTYEEI